ncbi:MAG TPA: hypothetical protein VM656_09115 [Pyrinomonadaceae bacterium]|nr:hypothetical protein [Pyrinomonadaceae bacterium]
MLNTIEFILYAAAAIWSLATRAWPLALIAAGLALGQLPITLG